MSTTRAVSCLALFTLAAAPAAATRWVTYTQADGLPALDIRDIVQAKDGRIWAATDNGLARIDRRQPSARWQTIDAQRYRTLAVDTRGVIWAGGDAGLLRWFDADGNALPTTVVPPPRTNVTALHAGPDGSVWIGEADSLRCWHPTLGTRAFVALRGPVWDIDQAASGRLWLALNDGFGYFDGTSIFNLPAQSSTDRTTSAILSLGHDQVVLGTSRGNAYHYSLATFLFSSEIFQDTESQRVEDIVRDAFGQLWFARQEAYRFETAGQPANPSAWTRTVLGPDTGLNGDILRVIFESAAFQGAAMTPIGSREMWFGSDVGIAVQTGFPWTTYNTATGGLVCTPLIATGNCNTVGEVLVDRGRDAIWFGALFGLSRLNDDGTWDAWTNGVLPGTPPGLIGNSVHALLLDTSDGRVWVASGSDAAPTGVQYQDVGATTWITAGRDLDRWRVRDMARDAAGLLWLAAADGAWRLDTSTVPFGETHFGSGVGVPPGELHAVTTTGSHAFVASSAGIGRFHHATSSWSTWPIADLGVPGPWVFRELFVQHDSLYAATNNGLIVVPVSAGSLAGATLLSAASDIPGGFATDLYGIAPGGDGTVLIAANTGLFRLSAGLERAGRMDARDGLPDANVLTVVTDGDEVWIGTEGDGGAGHVFEAPETAIVEPPGPVVVSSTNPVLVVVDAADLDSPADQLQFELQLDQGAWSAPQTGPNVTFVPAALGLADGAHTLHVRAIDNGLLRDATPAAATFELDTSPPIARITYPVQGAAVAGAIQILGTTDDLDDGRFDSYLVGARRDAADSLQVIRPWTHVAVVDSIIATWQTSGLPDDWYTLEVIVRDVNGVSGTSRLDVLVDNQPPFADVTSPQQVRGNDGASVYAVAGDAIVVLPPFAFDGERMITVDAAADAEADGGRRFALGPADLQLRKRATLELRASASGAGIAIHRLEGGTWVHVGGTREQRREGTFYAAAIDRLGVYALRTASAASTGGAVIANVQAEPRHLSPRTGGVDRIAVSFVLGRPASVTAMVYNRAGRPRRILVEAQDLGAGEQVLYWDGCDDDGNLVASALYIVAIEAGGERVTKVVTVGAD